MNTLPRPLPAPRIEREALPSPRLEPSALVALPDPSPGTGTLTLIITGAGVLILGLAGLETAGPDGRMKIIGFRPDPDEPAAAIAFPADWKSPRGQTVRSEDGKFTIRVPASRVVAVSQEIMAAGPVADLTIEDVPLEEIITELFAQPISGKKES